MLTAPTAYGTAAMSPTVDAETPNPLTIWGSQMPMPTEPTMQQKLMKASANTRQLVSAPRKVLPCRAASVFCSAASWPSSQSFSSWRSHLTFDGRSPRTKRHAMPRMTAGAASSTRSACQLFSPQRLPICMMAPEIGEPTMLAIGMPTRNAAVALARDSPGNQLVK
jgi:hypothetical protein